MSTTNTAPAIPARRSSGAVVGGPVVTNDIVTSSNAAAIGSTQSFTTNQGADAHVKSIPVTANEAPLVQPSHGLMHSLKKAFTTGSKVEQDPSIAHAIDTLRASNNHTKDLDNSLRRYQDAQRALQDAAVAVSTAFHQVLSDERNPYGSLASQTLRSVQLHPLVPSHGSQLTDLTSSAVADMDEGMGTIDQELRDRKVKQSDVEYYLAKVDKLSNTQEQHLTNNPNKVSASDSEKLERNIGKAKEVQLEYNAENERLISNMNALWRRRIVRLGPALSGFIAQNQLVYRDQAALWQEMLQASATINPDSVHTSYLTDSSTMLVPTGSAVINNSHQLNQAHHTVGKRVEVEQQQRLQADNKQRVQAVEKEGGRLETVQQDVIVRSEEQMVWTKERFVTERVRLRKVVATEMVTITVPVRRERVEVDRIPVDGPGVVVSEEETANRLNRRAQRKQQKQQQRGNTTVGANNTLSDTTADGAVYDDEYDDEQFELILCEERPRVVNDIVAVERVRMKKLTQVDTAHLHMDLRKEHIDFNAPTRQAGQTQPLVTQTGTMQTIEGQQRAGFVDKTEGQANVVMLPSMVSNESVATTGTATGTGMRTVRADVDDVAAMQSIGVPQGGQYGNVNTVGSVSDTKVVDSSAMAGANVVPVTHPYYNTSSADVKGTPDYATNETVYNNANTTTTASTTTSDDPVNRRGFV